MLLNMRCVTHPPQTLFTTLISFMCMCVHTQCRASRVWPHATRWLSSDDVNRVRAERRDHRTVHDCFHVRATKSASLSSNSDRCLPLVSEQNRTIIASLDAPQVRNRKCSHSLAIPTTPLTNKTTIRRASCWFINTKTGNTNTHIHSQPQMAARSLCHSPHTQKAVA